MKNLGDLLIPIGLISLGVSSLIGTADKREMEARLKALENTLQVHGISAATSPLSSSASLQAQMLRMNARGNYG